VTESFFKKLSSLWEYKVSKEKAQLFLPQVTYLGVVLKGQTPQSPSSLSPFEIMYGRPFLLGHLLPTDLAPLADYLPYLHLLWELLRELVDQILPHSLTISVKPGDLVLLKDLQPSLLGTQWTGPHLVILTTPTAVQLNGIPQWQHLSRIKHCPPTSGSSTTAKDKYSCIPLGPTRLRLSCKLSPSATPQ
jgi:hypothetical protein